MWHRHNVQIKFAAINQFCPPCHRLRTADEKNDAIVDMTRIGDERAVTERRSHFERARLTFLSGHEGVNRRRNEC